MKVLLSGGLKTENIVQALEKKFASSGDEFIVERYIEDINSIYSRGENFDKAIIIEQGITHDGEFSSENEIRQRVNQFAIDSGSNGINNVSYIFLAASSNIANMIYEEILPIIDKSAVVVKEPPYKVPFFCTLVTNDIGDLPSDLVFKPAEITEQEYISDEAEPLEGDGEAEEINYTDSSELFGNNGFGFGNNDGFNSGVDNTSLDNSEMNYYGEANAQFAGQDNFGEPEAQFNGEESFTSDFNNNFGGEDGFTGDFNNNTGDFNGNFGAEDGFTGDFNNNFGGDENFTGDFSDTNEFGVDNGFDGAFDNAENIGDNIEVDENFTGDFSNTNEFGNTEGFSGDSNIGFDESNIGEVEDNFDGQENFSEDFNNTSDFDNNNGFEYGGSFDENNIEIDESNIGEVEDFSNGFDTTENFDNNFTGNEQDFTGDQQYTGSEVDNQQFAGNGNFSQQHDNNQQFGGNQFEQADNASMNNGSANAFIPGFDDEDNNSEAEQMYSGYTESEPVNNNIVLNEDSYDTGFGNTGMGNNVQNNMQGQPSGMNSYADELYNPQQNNVGINANMMFDASDYSNNGNNYDNNDYQNNINDNMYANQNQMFNPDDYQQTPNNQEMLMGDMQGQDDQQPVEQNAQTGKKGGLLGRLGGGKQQQRQQQGAGLGVALGSTRVNVNKIKDSLRPFASRGNSIVVTGCGGCGTSVVAYNLANIVSQLGYTVLLVDMDTENKTQSYISKTNYDNIDHDEANLRSAVNSSTNISSHLSVVKQGFHLLTMGLAADAESVSEVIHKEKLNRFVNVAKQQHNFVIYDIPFKDTTNFLSEITYTCDNLVLVTDASNWGVTKTMLAVCNIASDDMRDTFFTRAQLVFNKYRNLNEVLGNRVRTCADITKVMDKKIIELLGEDPGYHFEDMHISGIINDDVNIENAWFKDVQYSDTSKGQEIFLELIERIVLNK